MLQSFSCLAAWLYDYPIHHSYHVTYCNLYIKMLLGSSSYNYIATYIASACHADDACNSYVHPYNIWLHNMLVYVFMAMTF